MSESSARLSWSRARTAIAVRALWTLVLLLPCPLAAGGPACFTNADCDDGLFCTVDVCLHPGTMAAVCDIAPYISVCDITPPFGVCDEDADMCICGSDLDCNDDLFCNGWSECRPQDPGADANGCVSTGNPCINPCICNEGSNSCGGPGCTPVDADGDGFGSIGTGGTDCDDADMNRYPSNIEICDVAMHDEDCDFATLGDRDLDSDGYIEDGCCNIDFGGNAICGTDCDDYGAGVNPGSQEVCNGVDDNCDASIDEGLLVTAYLDADLDGWGDSGAPGSFCSVPTTHAGRGGDCAVLLDFAHPTALEICNGIDDDCDGLIDEGYPAPCS